ncbi:MAG: F0F1 ATP synthase subunit epsilon [Planctomycetes bacterium]|nr:F0F1 ATP synthase subunit epsilon [Planctomycetota bacterium]
MVKISTGTFRFVLRTPQGTLIDCRTGSLLFPAHDGLQGVLRNHAPMLCKIGLGIIQVKEIHDREDAFFLVSSGFARISENFITVLSDDVTTFEGLDDEQAEEMLSEAKSHLAGGAYFYAQTGQAVDMQKAKLIVKMAEMAAIHS